MEFETAELVGRIWIWVMIGLMFFEASPGTAQQPYAGVESSCDNKLRRPSISEQAQRPLKICRRVDNF